LKSKQVGNNIGPEMEKVGNNYDPEVGNNFDPGLGVIPIFLTSFFI